MLRIYNRAKTLAEISHAGMTFRVVYWRGEDLKSRPDCFALLYGDKEVASSIAGYLNVNSPSEAAQAWKEIFERVYPEKRETSKEAILAWVNDPNSRV